MNNITKFDEAFKLPLLLYQGKCYDSKNHMVFDFAQRWQDKNCITVIDDHQKEIVDLLNGTIEKLSFEIPNFKFEYANSDIFVVNGEIKRQFISIRGWGYLTGTGGLRLKEDVAMKIQDDLAEYIMKTLGIN